MDDLLMVRKASFGKDLWTIGSNRRFKNDPQYLLKELVKAENQFKILYGLWESDFLYQANQEMVSAMQEQGLAVTFEQGPGDHNWIFWDQWIQRALAWLMEEK